MALCPPALQGCGSSDIFFHVVTPERIPQFVIPPLDSHKKQRCPDPTAWAALSLPHLPKVTTPYGFVTLARSPQVTREEAFFHSGSGHPRGPCCRHPGIPAAEGHSGMGGRQRHHKQPGPRAGGHKDGGSSPTPAGPPLPRCAGDIRVTEVLESQEAGKRDRRLLGTDCPGSRSPELPVATARKNLFQRILGRHLGHPRQLKPGHFTLH
ncbi:C2 calcium-dependent domain-containing protein 4B-like [Serinus canaria]|uniref:C2 calcium-dependent domain-containing protein 4B-like n=1 Tax=Serinus canaria TaxID=9135 RepID=UPI0021CD0DF7|nr:C2 calcium-dependent domain-containing protein 4B-like [Serinus canaria]